MKQYWETIAFSFS